jgi:hypothetical protein
LRSFTPRSSFPGHLDEIGQVVFALLVLAADTLEGGENVGSPDQVDAGVDLDDAPLGGAGVGLLHDADDAALLVADDPAVAAGIFQPAGQEGQRRSLSLSFQGGQVLGLQQGDVTVEDDQLSRETLQGAPGRHDRVAGAPGGILDGETHPVAEAIGQEAPHGFPRVAGHHHHGLVPPLDGQPDGVVNHRFRADLVHHLGNPGAHPLALASRQNHTGRLHRLPPTSRV